MAKVLKLAFKMENDSTKTLQVRDPKDNLQSATVKPIMQNIIDKEAILSGTAAPVEIAGAVIVETTEQTVVSAESA